MGNCFERIDKYYKEKEEERMNEIINQYFLDKANKNGPYFENESTHARLFLR